MQVEIGLSSRCKLKYHNKTKNLLVFEKFIIEEHDNITKYFPTHNFSSEMDGGKKKKER